MQTEQPAPAVLTGSAWEKYRYLTVILCAFIVSRVLFYFIGLMGHINFGTGEVLTMESLFNMWDRTADMTTIRTDSRPDMRPTGHSCRYTRDSRGSSMSFSA